MLEKYIYKKSPIMLQNLFLTARGFLYNFLRQGMTFKKIFSELELTQYFSESKIKDWQDERLSLLVRHVYENVPYYNKIFNKLRLTPDDIKDADDFKKLPLLTKEDVRRNTKDLLASNVNRFFRAKAFTSGTSGKPLKLYRDLYSINFENAILWRQRKWGGVGLSDKIAVLRDNLAVPFNVKKQPYCRYSISEKKLFLSTDHLQEKNVQYYVEALENFRPAAIEAEPSCLYILSKFINKKGVSSHFPSIKTIFTSSEMLLREHKELIEKVFSARIYDFYGNTERTAAIGMCEQGNYHVLPEYGITEFLPLRGSSGEAEIVGTSLHNYTMPLLRYRTGDIAQLSDSGCTCGRKFKTIRNIKGRFSDFFISRDGRFIPGFYSILADVDNVVESQIIQENLDRIKVRFVPAENFTRRDEKRIIDNARRYIKPEIELTLEQADGLIEGRAGKFRPFISHVSKRSG